MEKIITTELSFIPIISNNYNADVDEVIDIIASYKMEYTVGLLSTTVQGKRSLVFNPDRTSS